MKMFKKWLAAAMFMLLAVCNNAFAQAAEQQIEMADAMREDGKIYIVVAVLLTVLVGVLAYIIVLDRKVNKLEKQLKH